MLTTASSGAVVLLRARRFVVACLATLGTTNCGVLRRARRAHSPNDAGPRRRATRTTHGPNGHGAGQNGAGPNGARPERRTARTTHDPNHARPERPRRRTERRRAERRRAQTAHDRNGAGPRRQGRVTSVPAVRRSVLRRSGPAPFCPAPFCPALLPSGSCALRVVRRSGPCAVRAVRRSGNAQSRSELALARASN